MKPGTSRSHIVWLAINMTAFTILASMTNVFAKSVVLSHSPFFVGFWRFTLAIPTLGLMMIVLRRKIVLLRADRWRFVALGILVVPVNQLLFLIAMQFAPASHSALLYSTTPAWVLLLTLILGVERLRWWKLGGIALSIAGVVILLGGRGIRFSDQTLWGDALLLLAVFSWTAYTALSKPLVERYGPLEATFLVISFGGLIYFPFGLPAAIFADYSTLTTSDWVALLYLGLVTSGLVYFLWYWLVNYLRPTQVAVVTCALPPTTYVLAWLFLGETLTPNLVLGGVVTLAGIVMTVAIGGEKHTLELQTVAGEESA
jgi:drug/metabolite transporter (DMT)-like permease